MVIKNIYIGDPKRQFSIQLKKEENDYEIVQVNQPKKQFMEHQINLNSNVWKNVKFQNQTPVQNHTIFTDLYKKILYLHKF